MCFRQGSLILCCYLVSRPKRFRLLGKQQVVCKRPCSICNLAVCIFCLSKKTGGGLQKIFMCSSSVKISSSWLVRDKVSHFQGQWYVPCSDPAKEIEPTVWWQGWQNRNIPDKGTVPQWLNKVSRGLVMATRVSQKWRFPDKSVVIRKSEGQARMSSQQGKARIIKMQGQAPEYLCFLLRKGPRKSTWGSLQLLSQTKP